MEAERCEDGTTLPEAAAGPPVDLSMDLIKRSLLTSEDLQSRDADAMYERIIITVKLSVLSILSLRGRAETILQCRSLHLEWQNIGTIDDLESFTGLEELYLQYVSTSQISSNTICGS